MKRPRCRQALLLLTLGSGFCGTCPVEAAEPLQTAAQVRGLTVEQAQSHDPVKLRGVVTFFDKTLYSHFIQDETAGIYLTESTNLPGMASGQRVEVIGVTGAGEYAPVIFPERVTLLGDGILPQARPVTFDQLASGKEDSQFVEIAGIVRSVRFDETLKYFLIGLSTGGGRLTVYAKQLPVATPDEMIASTIRVRGVCSTVFNRQRQLFNIRLMSPRAEDLVIARPASADPYATPMQNIGSLLQFTPQGSYGNRVKVTGTLIYQQPGSALYLQDEKQGL